MQGAGAVTHARKGGSNESGVKGHRNVISASRMQRKCGNTRRCWAVGWLGWNFGRWRRDAQSGRTWGSGCKWSLGVGVTPLFFSRAGITLDGRTPLGILMETVFDVVLEFVCLLARGRSRGRGLCEKVVRAPHDLLYAQAWVLQHFSQLANRRAGR